MEKMHQHEGMAVAAGVTQSNSPRIGYLVGQFPGPSHTYFWREVTQLRQRGLQVEFCSTRIPTSELAPHSWTQAAIRQTVYLSPVSFADALRCLMLLILAGPARWLACLTAIKNARDVSLKERIKFFAYMFFGARLLQVARRHKWTHVHVGFCHNAANVAMFAKLLGDLPYSLSLHDRLCFFGPNQHQKWRHASFGTVITRKLTQELRDELGADLPPVLDLAPMGVELARFQRQSNYSPWRGEGSLRIFCCARIAPTKGYAELLDSVALVRQAGIDAKLIIAGEAFPRIDWYMDLLDQKMDQHKLRGHVDFLGAVPEERVRDELEKSHVFCLSSHCEGLGVAIMEAAAMCVPVISTNAGGVPELIDSGVDGLLVPPQNPEAFAQAIIRLAQNPELALQFSRVSRDKIERNFHSGRSADVMMRCLYRTTLSGDPSQEMRVPLAVH